MENLPLDLSKVARLEEGTEGGVPIGMSWKKPERPAGMDGELASHSASDENSDSTVEDVSDPEDVPVSPSISILAWLVAVDMKVNDGMKVTVMQFDWSRPVEDPVIEE
eukprot:2891500-Rhodomonas_salina.4